MTAMAGTAEADDVTDEGVPEPLRREFEELGLSPYEARTLLALMRLGSGNSLQLSRLGGVPRTSVYQIMQDLVRKGLAETVPSEGAAVWSSPSRDQVLQRLDADHEEQLRQHRSRLARVKEMLAESLPEAHSVAAPYVHLIRSAAHVRATYDRLLSEARHEVVVFNRPPYSSVRYDIVDPSSTDPATRDEVNPAVLAALGRGVAIRALYQQAQWDDASATDFRVAMAAYHSAGVEGRVVPELPIKLAVADRRVALLAMTDNEGAFPTNLLIEHEGFAALQAATFDECWARGRPCTDSGTGRGVRRPKN